MSKGLPPEVEQALRAVCIERRIRGELLLAVLVVCAGGVEDPGSDGDVLAVVPAELVAAITATVVAD